MAKSINLKIDNTNNVVMKTNLTNPRGRIEHYVGKKIYGICCDPFLYLNQRGNLEFLAKLQAEKKTNLS